MLTVLGYERSSNVQKVMWCAAELGVPCLLAPTGGPYGGHKDAPYLALNPNGYIPTLKDGDFVLWESNAILQYLVEKYGNGRLMPEGAAARAGARRWMDWQLATLNVPSGNVMRLTVRTPPDQQDAAAIKAAGDRLNDLWGRFEASFGDGPFVAGAFSVGDIPVGVHAHRYYRHPIARPDYPKMRAWYERLTARAAYADHVMAAPMPGE